MATVIAYDEAKTQQVIRENPGPGQSSVKTPFFGSADRPDFAHACLNQHDAGCTPIGTHYHLQNQFQVVVSGKGTLGRHELAPYCVHFTRAYTPYGPISTDAKAGLTFIVLRAHWDTGSRHFPEHVEDLKQVTDRRPWQVTNRAEFPKQFLKSTATTLQAISAIRDDDGLAAYTLTMPPNVTTQAPDPSQSDGQYVIVLKGSLVHNAQEHRALTLVFVQPQEAPLQLRAGPQGLAALILNFPRIEQHAVAPRTPSIHGDFKKWQCSLCAFAYDEALGLPHEGIAAGTRWEDVPDTWTCPDCSSSKRDFQMVEV